MTQNEREQCYEVINSVFPFLTDDELKALVVSVVTREISSGTTITNKRGRK
jgi:hypothetical protein